MSIVPRVKKIASSVSCEKGTLVRHAPLLLKITGAALCRSPLNYVISLLVPISALFPYRKVSGASLLPVYQYEK